MKCGKELNEPSGATEQPRTGNSGAPIEMLEPKPASGTFLPMEDDEYARLGPTTRKRAREPVGDVASYKEAAAAQAAAWEAEQEQAAILESRADAAELARAQDSLQADVSDTASAARNDAARGAAAGGAAAGGAAGPGRDSVRHGSAQQVPSADFVESRKFCNRCGMANPRDMRFCKNCGSAMDEPGSPASGGHHGVSHLAAPVATAPVEITTMADVSPSSAFTGAPAPGRSHQPRSYAPAGGRFAEMGVREWVGLIVGALVLALLVWLFFGGGLNLLFNAARKNISKAGAVMEKLPGFQFNISSVYETSDTRYAGSGRVMFDSPDRTYWELTRVAPAGPVVTGTTQVGNDTWVNTGGTWSPADPKTATGDIRTMWKNAHGVEKLGEQPVGNRANCYHYKYRVDPTLMATVLGLTSRESLGDAVVEIWIDSSNFEVARQSVELIGAQLDGARTRVTMLMELGETGRPFNIQPPG